MMRILTFVAGALTVVAGYEASYVFAIAAIVTWTVGLIFRPKANYVCAYCCRPATNADRDRDEYYDYSF